MLTVSDQFGNQRMLGHDCPCTVVYNGAKSVPRMLNVALLFSLREQYLLSPQCKCAGGSDRHVFVISVAESYSFSASKT